MPFIDDKYYMNPAYGRAVQRARAAEAASEHDESGQQQPGTHWVTIEGRHVLIHETQGGRTPHGNQSQPVSHSRIQFPSSDSERRLAVIVFNETGGLTPSAKSGNGSAANLHDARVATAEVSKRLIEDGHANRVAPDELETGLWQGLNDGNPAAVQAWNDSLSAARTALAGSNTTEDATHFRLDAKTGTMPPWAQGRQPAQTFGPFRNAGGGDAATPTTRFYIYR
jgi:hypothetical protein